MDAKSGSDSDDSLFGASSSSARSPQPEKKRRKLNDNQNNNDERDNGAGSTANNQKSASGGTVVDPALMKHAKRRLSKFAARLFDPNRKKVSVSARMKPIIVPISSRLQQSNTMRYNVIQFNSMLESMLRSRIVLLQVNKFSWKTS
jgi:hypothetical protein